MPNMFHVVAEWSGFPGAPGYTNLYLDGSVETDSSASAAIDHVSTFFAAVRFGIPADVTISFRPEVELIDPADGALLAVFNGGAHPAAVGMSGASYAAPAGVAVNWNTGGIHAGHRVRGRTFLVPLGSDVYQGDGSILDTALVAFRDAANAYAGSASPQGGVWARPKGLVAGEFFDTVSASVSDRVAILTSRRP